MQNEFEGKTVEDAIATGLQALGLTEDEAEIDIVQKGSRGIFGIGGSTALVRITSRSEDGSSEGGSSVGRSTAATSAAVTSTQAASTQVDGSGEQSSAVASPTQAPSIQGVEERAPDQDDADYSSDELYDGEEVSDDELADMAMDLLGKMVSLMGYDVEVTATWKEPEPGEDERCLTLDVEGDNLGALIGRRGETLDNLQYMLRLMVNQKIRSWCNIVVDVAGYKSRRADQLMQLALRVADQVAETGRPQSLEPMPSNERRIVHLALRESTDVYTESSGDSERRKVHIVPKSLTS